MKWKCWFGIWNVMNFVSLFNELKWLHVDVKSRSSQSIEPIFLWDLPQFLFVCPDLYFYFYLWWISWLGNMIWISNTGGWILCSRSRRVQKKSNMLAALSLKRHHPPAHLWCFTRQFGIHIKIWKNPPKKGSLSDQDLGHI